MIIGKGQFNGRNGYRLEGTFTLTRQASGDVLFETREDFFFGNNNGGGTPAPGFALYNGDPTNAAIATVEKVAIENDFLRIADETVSVSGKQSGIVPPEIDLSKFDQLFLWCYSVPVVLGVGPIETLAANGN